MEKKEQIQCAEKNLERLLEWVGKFDTKSSIILGIDTGMLAVLISFMPQLAMWGLSLAISTILTVATFSLSLFFIFLSSYPRTKAPSRSLIFFGTISEFSFNDYKKIFCERNNKDYLNDLLEQCHRNAEIISTKFKNLKLAYCMLLIGIIPWAITIFLFKIGTVPQ